MRVIIAQIITSVLLLVKIVFGVEVADEIVNQIVDAILLITTVGLGIFTSIKHKKTTQ